MTAVKVGLAQINPTVGNLRANAAKIADAARWAAGERVDILLTPELTLTGYPAEDLLLRPQFIREQLQVLEHLCAELGRYPGLYTVVGYVHEQDGALYNAAAVITEGRVAARYFKHELPDYGVFDEKRYFATGTEPMVLPSRG